MKYVHVKNGVVDFQMGADPFSIFTHDYASEFVFVENDNITNGWTYDDGIFKEPIITIQVPTQITPRQLRLQLLSANLLDEVETMFNTNREMQILFEYSLDFQRSHPIVEEMGVQLGLTQDDLDTMFIEASKL